MNPFERPTDFLSIVVAAFEHASLEQTKQQLSVCVDRSNDFTQPDYRRQTYKELATFIRKQVRKF